MCYVFNRVENVFMRCVRAAARPTVGSTVSHAQV